MKKVSEEHIKRMHKMCKWFLIKSKNDSLYLLKYRSSKKNNQMIDEIKNPIQSDFIEIHKIIKNIDDKDLHGGIDWYDYKLHVRSLLKENSCLLK